MKKLLFALAAFGLAASPVLACDELGEMRRAMREAQANTKEARRAAFQRSYAEAALAKDLMGEYLNLIYFPGLFDMRDDVIELTVGGDAAYAAVSARLAFLRGAPGSTIKLAVADRAKQFEALKADYRRSMAAAAEILRGLDENPGANQPLSSLSQWGVESSVQDGGKDSVPVLTRVERDAILKPAPAPERDPHE